MTKPASMIDEYEKLSPIIEPVVCIDRLTLLMQTGPVMGFYASSDAAYYAMRKEAINDFIYKLKQSHLDLFELKQPVSSTGLYLYHFRLKGGFDLQMCPKFGIRSRIKDEGYVTAFGSEEEQERFKEMGYIDEYFDSDYGIRLEFNPAKSNIEDIAPLLRTICDLYQEENPDITFDHLWKVTRFDVAVDYPEALNPALFAFMRKQKTGWVGGSDGIETAYFGSRRTFFYWRVYDKKRELFEEQDTDYQGANLWRIECECKKPFSIGEDSHFMCHQFRQMDYFYGLRTGDWKLDFILHYAKCFGIQNALKEIDDYRTRRRYQELLSKIDLDSIKHPARLVGWNLPPMWKAFYDTLKRCCGRESDPMIYVRNVRETMTNE